jgi:HEAT repeat protein
MRRGAFVVVAAAFVASSAPAQDAKPPAPSDAVLDLLGKKDDVVRETVFAGLLQSKDAAALDRIRVRGLAHADGIVRGYVGRACGRLHLDAAKAALEAQLDDVHWFARAEAAIALAELKDVAAVPSMRKIVATDPSEKARAAAMDALAMFGGDAVSAVPVVAKQLDHAKWQMRVAAAQTLGGIGSMDAVEPLIIRMNLEDGHVGNDIYAALKAISHEDLGRRAEKWWEWWQRRKSPDAPERPPWSPLGGLSIFTNRVAFLVDTSESMKEQFTPADPGAKERGLVDRPKLDLCSDQIAHAIAALDPRSYFDVFAFGAQVRSFQPTLVERSKSDAKALSDWLGALRAKGTADTATYFTGLRATVALGDEPDDGANFRDTPDTIVLVTDGVRADSPLLDPATLVEWFTSANRYMRVTVNVICLGSRGGDVAWLKRLAERNGGTFTLVAAK